MIFLAESSFRLDELRGGVIREAEGVECKGVRRSFGGCDGGGFIEERSMIETRGIFAYFKAEFNPHWWDTYTGEAHIY